MMRERAKDEVGLLELEIEFGDAKDFIESSISPLLRLLDYFELCRVRDRAFFRSVSLFMLRKVVRGIPSLCSLSVDTK